MDVQPVTVRELLNLAGGLQRSELGIRFCGFCWYGKMPAKIPAKRADVHGLQRTPMNMQTA